jgi:hypothetical protein
MTTREIIDVQLESFFGGMFPQKIQRLVDEQLNQGLWMDGYDLAVSQSVIEGDDAGKLLEIVLTQHPELRIDRDALEEVVADKLPQSCIGAPVSWIVAESGAYALSDTLRVARFDGVRMIWRSPRISFDGIALDSLFGGRLSGRAWWLGSQKTLGAPFEIDFETGELLEGQIVPEL